MTKHRIIKHEHALCDLEDRSEYLRRHNPRAALRFLDAAEATFRRLAISPGIGVCYDPDQPTLAELRFCSIDRFQYDIVFYRPIPDGIEVLRVLHGARDIQGILHREFGIGEAADVDGSEDEE